MQSSPGELQDKRVRRAGQPETKPSAKISKTSLVPSVPVPRCCWLDGVRTVKCGPRKMAKNFYYLLFNKRHSLASERKSFEREREEKKKLKKDEESCTVLFFEDLDERG